MPLRFTDTNKWRDPWYMDLPVLLKVLWQYLCDNCDNAGVWPVNRKLAEFEIGEAIPWDYVQGHFDGRVRIIDDGRKWHLTKFLAFQYPNGLSEASKPHQQVLRLLSTHGLEVSPNPMERVGGGVHGRSIGATKTRPLPDTDQTKGGAGGSAVDTGYLLAEFGLPAGKRDAAEWAGGLNRIAKCRSVDEARCFIRWAIDVCARQDVEVKHWRHVAALAAEWAKGEKNNPRRDARETTGR